MGETVTPIYGFPQWQDGDHGWGTSINDAFVSIENLIYALGPGTATAVGQETTRAQGAETALASPLSWGDLVGVRTWADINNEISNWSTAYQFTWGQLAEVRTWAHVYQTTKTWGDTQNYTWDTL